MLYRRTTAEEAGFETPEDEYSAMRDYAQHILTDTDPNDVLDTLLIMANVCEQRAILSGASPAISQWYLRVAQVTRAAIMLLNTPFAAPNAKLENPLLYFPDVEDVS